MSLYRQPIPPVPEETARVARIAFPRGNLYVMMRDELGTRFTDDDFTAPWRRALITIMQDIEDVSDRQAAEAVRGRIDWQYALS
jgi:hypothetical protein